MSYSSGGVHRVHATSSSKEIAIESYLDASARPWFPTALVYPYRSVSDPSPCDTGTAFTIMR